MLEKARRFIPLLVVAAGLLAYQNSLTGTFIFDDFGSIRENPTIRQLWPLWQPLTPPRRDWLTVEGRPLINLSLAINYAIGGYTVWGYHAVNLAIHILAGLTLLGIVRRTLLQPALRDRFGTVANELALAAAVLWTVHPLQTESVTYIVQRAESIMGLFYLLTLYCFIRGAELPLVVKKPRLWYGLSVIACAFGMASKEVMVTAPVMVMLYDRAFLSGSFREAWRRRRPLYLGLASTWIVLAFVSISAGVFTYASTSAQDVDLKWWQYLATQPGVILEYLRLSVWPSPLCLGRWWPTAKTWISILPPAAVMVILLGATIWAWKGNSASLRAGSAWGFVGAWFFLILAPSSSFLPLLDPFFEHRMYLPLAAVVCVVVLGLYLLAGRQSYVVFFVVAIGLGFLTWQRNRDYRSEITLWGDAAAKFPDEAGAHDSLAVALGEAGRFQEALQHWEQALQIRPGFADAHNNMGVVLMRCGRLEDAIGHYREALRVRPENATAHHNFGVALRQAGETQAAVEHWEQALRIKPDQAQSHYELGVTLEQSGKREEAIRHFRQALQIKADYGEVYNDLGSALWRSGCTEEACRCFEESLRLKPDSAVAQYNMGGVLEQAGRPTEAIAHYERALQLKPDFPEAQSRLEHLRAAR